MTEACGHTTYHRSEKSNENVFVVSSIGAPNTTTSVGEPIGVGSLSNAYTEQQRGTMAYTTTKTTTNGQNAYIDTSSTHQRNDATKKQTVDDANATISQNSATHAYFDGRKKKDNNEQGQFFQGQLASAGYMIATSSSLQDANNDAKGSSYVVSSKSDTAFAGPDCNCTQ